MKPYPHCLDDCRFIRDGKCRYREMHTPTIAVDFDRVLFKHESWQGHHNVGEPIPGARLALSMLRERGFKIMIWTTRAQKEIIKEACDKHGIPFDYINENPNQPPEINPSKPVADYYIDDRAVRFTSWPEVFNEIKHREDHDPYYRDPATQELDGKAIFGKLKWINESTSDLMTVDDELKALIQEIERGEYNKCVTGLKRD